MTLSEWEKGYKQQLCDTEATKCIHKGKKHRRFCCDSQVLSNNTRWSKNKNKVATKSAIDEENTFLLHSLYSLYDNGSCRAHEEEATPHSQRQNTIVSTAYFQRVLFVCDQNVCGMLASAMTLQWRPNKLFGKGLQVRFLKYSSGCDKTGHVP